MADHSGAQLSLFGSLLRLRVVAHRAQEQLAACADLSPALAALDQ
ncbi:MAG: hypothetical protein ACXWQ5_22665 [Ktedonobacterales bacterium]